MSSPPWLPRATAEEVEESGIVQFPLVVEVQSPAEHIVCGILGAREVRGLEHHMMADAPVLKVD